jgi:predicted nucleotidyltransferase
MSYSDKKIDPNVGLKRLRDVLQKAGIIDARLYVTGSRLVGKYRNTSDIDIAMALGDPALEGRDKSLLLSTIQERLNGTGVDFMFEDKDSIEEGLKQRRYELLPVKFLQGKSAGTEFGG